MHAGTAVLHREPVELWFYPVLDCCFGGVWWDFIFFSIILYLNSFQELFCLMYFHFAMFFLLLL